MEKSMKKKVFDTKFIVRAGIFSALTALLYIFIKFPVPIFPSFLEFHFDEVPAFIASFAYGPLMGIIVLIIKTLIKLPFTQTLCVGELCDLLYSSAFIIPAAFIYKRHKNFSGVMIGFALGFVLQIITSLILNIYMMIPFYIFIMGFSEETILSLAQVANPNIMNIKWSFGLFAVVPFNVIKNIIVILITLPTYKSVHRLINKI